MKQLFFLIAVGLISSVNVFGATQVVPDVSVDTLQGKYTFSEHRGKTLILFFSFPG